MIKITENISFKRDAHGYVLTHTFPTDHPKAKSGTASKDYFYPSLEQVCAKALHLACNDDKVEQDLEDLRNAYYTVLGEMKQLLEGK